MFLWSYITGNAVESSPVVVDGVVDENDGKVYALSSDTGALMWSHTIGQKVVFSWRFKRCNLCRTRKS